jgi:predicted ArsR family transcriptional regulator
MAGEQALDEIFERIAIRHASAVERQVDGLDFEQKLDRVLSWINRAGTQALAEECEAGVKITVYNCPFRNTALKFPQVCTLTPQLIVRLLDAPVSQSSSIHRGDPHCAFIVQRPDADERSGS